MSALETEQGIVLTANLLQKIDRVFYVTIADTDTERLKSLHTSFDKYWDHMLVKNKMVILFLTKCWRHFGRCFGE